jgi:hypothetical protein
VDDADIATGKPVARDAAMLFILNWFFGFSRTFIR